ncbi:hypothetical protein [Candidatus Leptofilum sp.]|uniref:hypothetical protein n=1 Tax=Candidatus Leptofilum sp. TaxID=3241576 RepID=UPI003B5906E6
MTSELQENLLSVMQQAGQLNTVNLMQNYLVELPVVNETQDAETIQQIKIALDQEGDITVATSIKIPNLKFKLGEFLLEAVSSSVALASSTKSPIKLALVAIRFLQKILQLSSVDIDEFDAKVLVALYKLEKEDGILTVDQLVEVMERERPDARIAKSLENLERLSCITLTMGEIILNEVIVIRSS